MTDSRYTALQIFAKTLNEQTPLTFSDNIPETELGFIRMLLLTAFRHLPYLQKIIKKTSSKNSKIRPLAKHALILGATELIYLSSPDYAIINSYVNYVKKHSNQFAAGFVNAVLRKISATKSQIQNEDAGEFFSDNFRSLLLKNYSPQAISLMEQACICEPLLDITLSNTNSDICALGQILPLGTLRLSSKGKISDLPDYKSGNWWVQDFSSSLPVKMLDNLKNKSVLDLCAAPGGKTAQLLSAGAKVTAIDISESRLQKLKQNLQRLHLTAQNIICSDALDYLVQTDQKYDLVLLDAPCSATGTLRRHPEIACFKTSEDVARQSSLQQKLLEASLRVIKPHGYLVYCTCSLCPEEGELQINSFLQNHSEQIQLIDLTPKLPQEIKHLADSQGFIRVLPHFMQNYGYADGFFIAVLKILS